jgi:putative ABC transport system permease protein
MKTHSDAGSVAWFDDLRRDLLYALRTLAKAPAFTAVAVLTLALGIGAVTVIYSVVHNVVVDPLPYRDAGRLVNVSVKDSRSPRVRGTFAVPELLALREGTSAFEDVIGTLGQLMTYERSDGVESLRGVWVTPNFFDFMGIEPWLGRTAGPADTTPDAPAVVVLRHRAWVRYFAADPGVVGTTILLNGERRTVIGVMPPRFTWHAADLWMPAPLDRAAANAATTIRNFQARLGPGVTLQQAEAQLDAAAQARAREYPQDYPEKFRMQVVNVIEYTVGPFSGVLYTALAAVGLLLLIA